MLKGKRAFVTGGSGAVGAAIVRAMAGQGCTVAFSYHQHQGPAEQLAAELTNSRTVVRAFPLDVRDGAAAIALAQRVEEEMGPLDILVNNAGVAQVMPFALIDEADWDLVLDTNIKGMFLVTKAFVRGMVRRKRGNIVNMSSLAGLRVLEVPVHYATAKSAVVGFTLSLARELSRYHIRVNAVVPGMLTAGVSANVPQAQQEEYARFCTLGRPGTPEEVANVVAFLSSDRSSYINAQALFVDGGI